MFAKLTFSEVIHLFKIPKSHIESIDQLKEVLIMTFTEQVGKIKRLNEIGYGCFNIVLKPPIEEKMCLRHISGKMDYLSSFGNRGSPEQFLYLFKELCDYLDNRNINYRLKYKWTSQNSIRFNLECLYLFLK